VVGCVANLRPVKNIDGFLRAAKLVADRFPHVRFEVAGDGPDRAELESHRAELGLVDRFTFRGSVSDVPGFLRELDIAVLPSHSEGMSNAVLEYMAAGKAIVATDVGANAKLLGDGQYGRLVPAGDTSALADSIGKLVADPDTVKSLGKSARARVEAEYSRAAMVRRFERFYAELARK
jgi:glycosyltransferase involved in cell wall biosynthesis